MAVAERTAGKQRTTTTETGAWAWALQRFTAAVIGVFISIHIWALHMARSGAGPVTFESVRERVSSPLYATVDLLLLASLLYHALNGVRTVLLDFGIGVKSPRLLAGVLSAIGVLGFAYGVLALISFILGVPLFR
ncbi:MAG: succinate dehydrogenase, cytochrome b556 subunit [Chloroflexi bacterium]|nr:succinate dehydrogenase, cytochrome b556 subunit [Chloroflexota bacterium]